MSDTSPFGFASFVPGFEFLQDLTRQTMAASAGAAGPAASPGLGQWVAPTFNVEELDKRIQELKTVQFWLEQNAKALGATVQALQVQKMTLSALRDMNVSLGDVADAMKIRPTAATSAPAQPAADAAALFTQPHMAEPAPEEAAPADAAAPEPSGSKPTVDPMQWWSALSQQFQTIAAQAVQDVASRVPPATARPSAKAASSPVPKAPKSSRKASPKAAAQPARPAARSAPSQSAKGTARKPAAPRSRPKTTAPRPARPAR